MSKKQIVFNVVNQNEVPCIAVIGYIGTEEDEVDYSSFISALNAIKQSGKEECIVELNTGGGDVMEGLAMYDAAKTSGLIITTRVIGMAASMGFILSQCASKGKRKAFANSSFMCHLPKINVQGDSTTLRNQAERLDKLEGRAIAILMENTGKSEDEVKTWMKPGVDMWMTAQEALEMGIIDEIIASDTKTKIDTKKVKNLSDAWKVYNSLTTTKIMLKQTTLAGLGLDANADVTAIDARVEQVLLENKKFKEQLEAAKEKEAEDFVADLVSKGKVTAEKKDAVLAEAKVNFQAVKLSFDSMPEQKIPPASMRTLTKESGGNSAPQGRDAWSFKDWSKNDYSGLMKMREEQPEKYKELFKKTGVSITS
jgi:ATP-dependent Clp protease protease subunit